MTQPFVPNDPGPYLYFKLNDTFDVECFINERYPGMDIVPKTVENALRRGKLKFYQLGVKRYTTPLLIDEWLQSLVTTVGAKAAAES